MNIFEKASRSALRILSARGYVTVEDLWNMPLTSKTGFDLDTLAKTVNSELKRMSEESFVKTKQSEQVTLFQLKLDIIKHIIDTKQEEQELRVQKAERAAKRAKLIDQLGKKQDAAMEAMSEEEIKAELAKLDE